MFCFICSSDQVFEKVAEDFMKGNKMLASGTVTLLLFLILSI